MCTCTRSIPEARPGCPRCQHLGGAPRDEARRVEEAAVGHRGQLRRPARPGATGGSQAQKKAATHVSPDLRGLRATGSRADLLVRLGHQPLGISLSQPDGSPTRRTGLPERATGCWPAPWKGCKTGAGHYVQGRQDQDHLREHRRRPSSVPQASSRCANSPVKCSAAFKDQGEFGLDTANRIGGERSGADAAQAGALAAEPYYRAAGAWCSPDGVDI